MKKNYSIIHNLSATHLDQLHSLSSKMWWSTDRTKEDIVTMLKHCMPFAVIDDVTQQLVGFARVMTDEIRYAYIYDVMAEEPLRGKGIGKMIMQAILSHPQLSDVKYFELTCTPEMRAYYEQFGFTHHYQNVIPMRLLKKTC